MSALCTPACSLMARPLAPHWPSSAGSETPSKARRPCSSSRLRRRTSWVLISADMDNKPVGDHKTRYANRKKALSLPWRHFQGFIRKGNGTANRHTSEPLVQYLLVSRDRANTQSIFRRHSPVFLGARLASLAVLSIAVHVRSGVSARLNGTQGLLHQFFHGHLPHYYSRYCIKQEGDHL